MNRRPTTDNSQRCIGLIRSLILLLVVGGQLFVAVPAAYAQFPDLVICGEAGSDGVLSEEEQCDFNDLVQLAINLIDFMIILSTFLAVAVFAFIGIKLLTSGGNERALDDAKEMAWKVLKGYLWILGAWLIVYTIDDVLLKDGYSILEDPR